MNFVSGCEKVDVMDEETLNKMSPAEKQQVMAQVQQQVALAQMQELLTVRFACSDRKLLLIVKFFDLSTPFKELQKGWF